MPAYHYQQGDRPLEGYTIEYALGRGGFGEVYFAISDAGREVALKAVQNYEEVELRGISHCMNLKSPNLVMIFDVKHGTDGSPWVIMEYVSGPSLRDILDEAPEGIGADKTMFFMRELAQGIGYLHDAGVVHRDLKPHNVFFEDGIVKIGDYSLSKAISQSHRSGHTMTVGSVHYMAPEISLGRYDKTVDIYAMGVLLYEMLQGAPPFTGESVGEILMKHLKGEPDVTGIAEPFARVITKAMDKEPANRFQSARELYQALNSSGVVSPDDEVVASLSLVGKQTEQGRGLPKSPSPTSDTFHSPAALRDTNDVDFDLNQEVADENTGWEERSRQNFHLLLRFGSSLLITAFLMTLVILMNPEHGARDDLDTISAIVLGQWGISVLMGYILLGFFSGMKGMAAQIISRFTLLVPIGISIVICEETRFPTANQQDGPFFFAGVVAAILLIDWRIFCDFGRQRRVSTQYTLTAGFISAIVVLIVSQNVGCATLASASVMAGALTVQLLAFPYFVKPKPLVRDESAIRETQIEPSGQPKSNQLANAESLAFEEESQWQLA